MIQRNPKVVAELIPLRFLGPGEIAEVGELVGKPDQVHRLHELGMIPGAQLEMIQPGSPCIIRLAGHKLCFRESEMIGVLVRTGAVD